jgi:hypothetical protein
VQCLSACLQLNRCMPITRSFLKRFVCLLLQSAAALLAYLCLPSHPVYLLSFWIHCVQRSLRTEVFLSEVIPWWLAPVGYGGLGCRAAC